MISEIPDFRAQDLKCYTDISHVWPRNQVRRGYGKPLCTVHFPSQKLGGMQSCLKQALCQHHTPAPDMKPGSFVSLKSTSCFSEKIQSFLIVILIGLRIRLKTLRSQRWKQLTQDLKIGQHWIKNNYLNIFFWFEASLNSPSNTEIRLSLSLRGASDTDNGNLTNFRASTLKILLNTCESQVW